MEHSGARRVRLLCERESRSRPSTLEPGDRKTDRRVSPSPDPSVQRLRGTSRRPIQGNGSQDGLLGMEARRKKSPLPWLRPAVLTGSLVPLAAILTRAWSDSLGPDPIAQALNQLGLIALVFLVAALGCTPLKTIFGWTWPMRIRRMLGLLAFFYALLNVITYTVLDQGLDWNAIVDDVLKRKFIFLGFSTFVLLIPLAATSTNSALRRLGYVRWKQLHRLAYLAPALAVLHFTLRVKRDESEPLAYGLVLAALLTVRLIEYMGAHRALLTRET